MPKADKSATASANFLSLVTGFQAQPVCPPVGHHASTHRLGDERPRAPKGTSLTPAEKAVIKNLHASVSLARLLSIINERRACDGRQSSEALTLAQLKNEVECFSGANAMPGGDWPSLRKLIATARRDGVLDLINGETVDDFAVVFSLTPKQLMLLKEIVLQPRED